MSRILLDTHLLIWALDELDRLPEAARGLIQDPANEIVFSAVSIWEIAIKARLGRTAFTARPVEIAAAAIAAGFVEFPCVGRRRLQWLTCRCTIATHLIASSWLRP